MEPLSVEDGVARPLQLRATPRCTVHWGAWPAAATVLSLLAAACFVFSDGVRSPAASLLVAAPAFILPSRPPRSWPPVSPMELRPQVPRQYVSLGAGIIPLQRRAILRTVVKSNNEEWMEKLMKEGAKPDVDTLVEWWKKMEDAGVTPDVDMYNRILEAFIRENDGARCMEWFKKMEAAGVKPDAVTHAIMLGAHAQMGDSNGTVACFKRLEEAQEEAVQEPEPYNLVIAGLAAENDTAGAKEWFGRMRAAGVRPDRNTYSLLAMAARIGGLGVDEATEWLRKEALGSSDLVSYEFGERVLGRNVSMYNRQLLQYVMLGDVNKSVNWFKRMQDDGVEPDVDTYSHMLMVYTREGDAAASDEWLAKLEAAGGRPAQEICHMQMLMRAGERDFEGTVAWFDRMVDQGVTPDVEACNRVILTFSSNGIIAKSVEWFDRMVAAGVVPDIVTYNFVVMAYAENGDLGGCKTWIKRMEDAGIEPDDMTHQLLRAAEKEAAK